MFERILITGGCGFLGQYLTRELLAAFPAAQLKLLDLKPPAAPLFDFSNRDNVFVAAGKDVTDYATIEAEFAGAQLVIHLAGLVSFSLKDRAALAEINVAGTQNVLAAARKHGAARVLHVSSVAALGYRDHPTQPADEDFQFDWAEAVRLQKQYMLSKHHADEEAERYRAAGLDVVILYPGLMFGPGDRVNSLKLLDAVQLGRLPCNLPGGTNIVDVRDVAAGIVLALRKNLSNQSILLAGHNLTFEAINRTIAEELGVRRPRVTLPRALRPLLVPVLGWYESLAEQRLELTADNLDSAFKYRYFSNQRALEKLGWLPRHEFRETIRDTADWMRAQDLFSKPYRPGLRDKVVLITGASSGIGRAAALEFARAGAKVAIAARRKDRLETVREEVVAAGGGECLAISADVSRESAVRRAFDQIEKKFGPVEILINNAGRGLKAELTAIEYADWKELWAANVDSVFLCSREAARRMIAHKIPGHLITVSSFAGKYAFPGYAAYCASKFGVTGFKRALRRELRRHRIKVSTIYPGRVDTEFFDRYGRRPGPSQLIDARDVAEHLVAIGRRSTQDCIAARLRILLKRLGKLLQFEFAAAQDR